MPFTTEFGYLDHGISLDLPELRIRPCDNFLVTQTSMRTMVNPDGYFYPPTSEVFRYPNGIACALSGQALASLGMTELT
jgi:hypothetical protein